MYATDINWTDAWFHFLCKNVNIKREPNGYARIIDPRPNTVFVSQADWTWHRAGFVLRWTSAGDNLDAGNLASSRVTLICFGASSALEQRFEALGSHTAWHDAVKDPYCLFAIVLDELLLQTYQLVWNLADVFRKIENVGPYSRCSLHA